MAGADPLTLKQIATGAVHAYAFDEASGNLIDHAGSNDGTITGAPTRQVDDQRGIASAYDFDGTNDYVTLSSNILNGVSAYTIEAVVNFDSVAASQVMVEARDGNGDGVVAFIASGGSPRFLHNASTAIIGPTIPAATWVHLHYVWNGTTATAYGEGAPGTPVAVSSAISTTSLGRIAANFSGGQPMDGKISSVAIYHKALSQAEIDATIVAAAQVSTSPIRRIKYGVGLGLGLGL